MNSIMPKGDKDRFTTEYFINRSKLLHGDQYDYSRTNYVSCRHRVDIICKKHGLFTPMAADHVKGHGCAKCHIEKLYGYSPSTETFIEKARQVHGDKYDYHLVDYKNSYDKVTIICKIHGPFEQSPYHHLQNQNCKKCSLVRVCTNPELSVRFIEDSKKVHSGKYTYEHVQYINKSNKVDITCPVHGIFSQLPSAHLGGQGCPPCSKESSIQKNRVTLAEFLQRARDKYPSFSYDYSMVEFNTMKDRVTIHCLEHGEFHRTCQDFLSGNNCLRCRKDILKKQEQERLEQERLEQERLEQERLEQERLEQERLEQERLEQERLEQERLEQERLERERLERERLERERLEQERLEQERLEQERLELKRLELKRLERERLERERLERERLERERLERERLERERLERERLERERLERERLERERLELKRLELKRLEKERLELKRLELKRLEQERLEQERLEQERLEQERLEQERLERNKWKDKKYMELDPVRDWITMKRVNHPLIRMKKDYLPGTQYYVDGYDPTTKTVYEFHRSHLCGDPRVFPQDVISDSGLTMKELYRSTLKRKAIIKSLGYHYQEIWEYDWLRFKRWLIYKQKMLA